MVREAEDKIEKMNGGNLRLAEIRNGERISGIVSRIQEKRRIKDINHLWF